MFIVYNENIESRITEEEYAAVYNEIDECVRLAIEDRLDTSDRTRRYMVDYDKGEGYVDIMDTESVVNADGYGLVVSADDVRFEFDENGYMFSGIVSLWTPDGDIEVVEYDIESGWKRF